MMKTMMMVLAMATATGFSAQAAQPNVCKKLSSILTAAEGAFQKSESPEASEATLSYADKNGKDKWMVTVGVQEECLAGVVVYTEAGTCKVISVKKLNNMDCG